jgi:hypothetical protein
MAPTDRSAANAWAVQHVLALVEIWALVAKHSGLVGAWRLTGVCRAALAGAKEWLGTLPSWVVYGGADMFGSLGSEGWRLDLATLRWGPLPALVPGRGYHSCCTVRGALVVLGGEDRNFEITSVVKILSGSGDDGGFTSLPPLSCGGIFAAVAISVEERDSAKGQVLLLGGSDKNGVSLSTVHLVDLATGVCTPQPALLDTHYAFTGVRILDGRVVVCAGGGTSHASAEVWGPLASGAANTAWTWTQLPAMSVGRFGCCGCVMSDGRLAVLGGMTDSGLSSSCEALMVIEGGHWVSLPPMHRGRSSFTCAAVGRCIIVAGGPGRSAEAYDETLNRWTQLPCDVPGVGTLRGLGSALL